MDKFKPNLKKRRLLFYSVTLAVTQLFLSNTQAAGKYAGKTSPVEIAQLPKYCYAQYVDENLSGNPAYSIQGCGGSMNHFCPGLVKLIRARTHQLPMNERRGNANMAVDDFKYTLREMTPTCVIRADVLSALEQAKHLQGMLR